MVAGEDLWLSADQQDEWVNSKKQVPTLSFLSFLAFNALAWASLRIINRKGRIKHPKNLALLKAAVCAATHAIISLAASAYALVHSNTARCEGREFCHDDMSARLMTVHAGYALFEILYWQNSSPVAAPWQEMLLLHDAITILTSFAYLLYPSRLSLELLPYRQLLEAATLADALRRFTTIYGAPAADRFKAQLAFVGTVILRAVGGLANAAHVFYWIRAHNLWKQELPEGMSSLNGVYGMTQLAGSLISALIYIKWMGAAVRITSDLVESINAQRGGGSTDATAATVTLTAGGKKKQKGGGSAKKRR